MSTGLAAIGLTFTGISIAAIANAVQEQCALGPTIVYEAGRDASLLHLTKSMLHRDQDLRFEEDRARRLAAQGLAASCCEAASAAGKLALKHGGA